MGKNETQKDKMKRWEERKERAQMTHEELEQLKVAVDEMAADTNLDDKVFTYFNDLPLSGRTKVGLERAKFTKLTPVQQRTIPACLAGRDILGAAKTGSGKTLAFVVPLIERLYREEWNEESGVGALVLSPTRELAMQIFKVLQAVGFKHTFSAALLTGGRNAAEERKRLHVINIVIGTPGRVLAHLSEDSGLNLDNLMMFAMDEADRLLDMGFREQLTSIVSYLPPVRQTVLFSATQTTDVKALAELALNDPKYVSVHAQAAAPTPTKMCQNFMVVELHRKLDALLMFLKKHPNDKIIVFMSTCNQVRYMYLAFAKILKKMRIPAMCLTGKMKQFRRDEIFMTFCRAKSAVLFCTDIAARGLDFPLVHWVVQYDCPDSVQTYIHRAGRTARAGARAVCLLMVTPQETTMLSYLHAKQIPLREVSIRPQFIQDSKEIFVALVVQGLKYEAQKAFISYLRSVHFAANKLVFDLDKIDIDKFAHSLGLLVVPNTADLAKTRHAKNLPWDVINYRQDKGQEAPNTSGEDSGSSTEGEDAPTKGDTTVTRRERHMKAKDMFDQLQKKHDRYTNKDHDALLGAVESAAADDDDDDDIFTVRKKTVAEVTGGKELTAEERMAGLSKNKKQKLLAKADLRIKDLGLSKHKVFKDDEDEAVPSSEDDELLAAQIGKALRKGREDRDASQESVEDELPADEAQYRQMLANRLAVVKAEDRDRRKDLMKARDRKKKEKLLGTSGEVNGASLAGDGDDDDGDYDQSEGGNSDLEELLLAAKGQLYEDDVDEDQLEDAPPKKKARKARR